MGVDRFGRALAAGRDQGIEVLQDDGIDLSDLHRRAVEALHQVFAGSTMCGVAKSHLCCECGLHVEDQTFLAAVGDVMELDTQIL